MEVITMRAGTQCDLPWHRYQTNPLGPEWLRELGSDGEWTPNALADSACPMPCGDAIDLVAAQRWGRFGSRTSIMSTEKQLTPPENIQT